MLLYSLILFLTALPMGILSIAIYRGKTDLIQAYHQTRVTDPTAYGKAFGKAMALLSLGLLLSGIIGLLGNSKTVALVAVAVLIIGLVTGIACIIRVQKKFNKGIF